MSAPGETFLGVPRVDLAAPLPPARFVIVGASEATPHQPGRASHAASAPRAIRAALSRHEGQLARWDFDQDRPLLDLDRVAVVDAGDLPTHPGTPDENRAGISAAVRKVLANGSVPIVLGGDDSVPIPVFAAFEALGDLTIVQIDAHLDWSDERNGQRYTFSSPMRRASEMPWVKRIVQIGLRGIGGSREADVRAARDWGSIIFTAREVRRHGIAPVIDRIPPGSRCLVTIDCDGLDPSIAPGVIVPQPGGLSYDDVLDVLDGVCAKAQLVGLNVVELVPERDVGGLTALVAARLVCNAIGSASKEGAGA